MLLDVDEVMRRFRVSREFGFLVNCGDVQLSSDFKPLIQICDNLPRFTSDRSIRRLIENLPEIETSSLLTYPELRLAHTYLVTAVSAYLWCEGKEGALSTIPENLAKALVDVSERSGMPPVVNHPSTCCANWKLIDRSKPFSPDNLETIAFNHIGTRGNAWFFVVTAQIEKDWGEAIYRIVEVVARHKKGLPITEQLPLVMAAMEESLRKGLITIQRMKENLTASEFYHGVRPYLWGYNEGKLKDTGVIMKGHEHLGPFKHGGASAAQSSTITVIDAFLQVRHAGSDQEFLTEQLDYIPREHRQLIDWVRQNSPITEKTEGRDSVLAALKEFRSIHIQIVAYYILSQIGQEQATGTGGTSVMKFLKNLRDDSQ